MFGRLVGVHSRFDLPTLPSGAAALRAQVRAFLQAECDAGPFSPLVSGATNAWPLLADKLSTGALRS